MIRNLGKFVGLLIPTLIGIVLFLLLVPLNIVLAAIMAIFACVLGVLLTVFHASKLLVGSLGVVMLIVLLLIIF